MRRACRACLTVAVLAVCVHGGCEPIPPTVFSRAPRNECPANPCERFEPGRSSRPQCSNSRCEFPETVPEYAFRVAITVPSSSLYAPGQTFLLSSDSFRTPVATDTLCRPPGCVRLPRLGQAIGSYRFTDRAAQAVGLPLAPLSVPVQVTFVPLLTPGGSPAPELGLPLDRALAFSQRLLLEPDVAEIDYLLPLPAGRYLRYTYPQAPFDEYLPPFEGEVRVSQQPLNDHVVLDDLASGDEVPPNTLALDDTDTRKATLRRDEGLDGFHVWLSDKETGRRISTVRSLSGTSMTTLLATAGQSEESGALRSGIDIVLAPPDDWIAVPRLQSEILSGELRTVQFPPLPPPSSLSGLVAGTVKGVLSGIPSRLLLTSERLREADGTPTTLLRYTTTVSTDESGFFATVVPPGDYDVLVEPAEGTGFSKARLPLEVGVGTRADLRVPPRTKVTGRAILGDGRPLADAEVLAVGLRRPFDSLAALPRPARSHTSLSGEFAFELDQGPYEISVRPAEGTGFPKVVTLTSVSGERTDLPVVTVPAPTKLSFEVRDPSPVGIPIAGAVVRVFTESPGNAAQIEIGRAVTSEKGACEILLAQQPR